MQTTLFQSFDQVFRKKLQKVWDFVTSHNDLSISPETSNFRGNYQVLGFYEVFRKKLQKLWHFVENHQNLSISPKLAFSGANYHVLGF